MTHLSLSNLSKTYSNGVPAVKNLSLSVQQGELLALLGPSGSGKTTLLRLIAGLSQPDRGDIRFNGQSVSKLAPQHRGAVMVFQQHQLFPFMTVADNIAFGLKIRKLNKTQIAQKIETVLQMVQLPGYQNRLPGQLSGGERQRVALARALVLNPNILLLDEPLSNLDATLREDLREMIRQVQKQTGVTAIFVTHDQTEAVAIADRIALMSKGELKQVGTARQFFDRPVDAEVARFFGGVNFLPGKKTGSILHTPLGPLEVDSPHPDGQTLATIRPEAIQIGLNGYNNFQATVQKISFQGLITKWKAQLQGYTLHIVTSAPQTLQTGAEITIHLPKERIWLLPPETASLEMQS